MGWGHGEAIVHREIAWGRPGPAVAERDGSWCTPELAPGWADVDAG
jgi:hypothetical protein